MFCSSAFTEGEPAADEEKLYQQCKTVYGKGKFADASQCIEEFLSLYPDSKYSVEMLFMRAFIQPDIDESLGMYLSIIEENPESTWIAKSHFQIAQCYYLQSKYDKALDHYGKIIVFYPEDESYWPALYWKCKSLIAKGDYERAMTVVDFLNGSETSGIGKDMILMAQGSCYRGLKDYKNAAASYRSLIESVPDSHFLPSAYLLLARSLQDMGDSEEAKAAYQKLIESYGKSIETRQAQEALKSLLSSAPKIPKTVEPAEKVEPETKEPDKTAEESGPVFSIQVGAFSSKRNAENLANQLGKKGYSVSIVPPIPGESRLYKVRVGNFKTENEALEAERKFRKNERMDTKVVNQ